MVAISQSVETGLYEYTTSRLDDVFEIEFEDSPVEEAPSYILENLLKALKIIRFAEDQMKSDIDKCNLEVLSRKGSN